MATENMHESFKVAVFKHIIRKRLLIFFKYY